MEVLEDERYIPLVVLGSISSVLSILGSGCVIYMSWRELHKFMHRLMFALSVADFISSITCLLMPFLLPSYLGLAASSGNHASCSTSGFFLMSFIMVGCCYNAYLSVYFFLVVCRSWKERDFQQPYEAMAHAFAFLVPIGVNVAAAATQSINPSPLINSICTYATWPWTCNENPDLECERSSRSATTSVVVLSGIFLFAFTVLGFVCTFMVWNNVRTTFGRSSNYRFEGTEQRSATDERILQVRTQAILYSLIYLNTFFWPSLATALSSQFINSAEEIQEIKLNQSIYVLQVCYYLLYPLQGFLNFFVYVRLRVKRLRKSEPDRHVLGLYKEVILCSHSSVARPSSSSAPPRSTLVAKVRDALDWSAMDHSRQRGKERASRKESEQEQQQPEPEATTPAEGTTEFYTDGN